MNIGMPVIDDEPDLRAVLRDGARRALADLALDADPPSPSGVDAATVARTWAVAAGLGWPLLLLPDAFGGLGGRVAEAVALAEEIGAALAPGPFAVTLALAPALALQSDDAAFRDAVLAAVAGGARIALAESRSVQAARFGPIQDLAGATHLLIVAADAPTAVDVTFIALDRPGITIEPVQPLDPTGSIGSVRRSAATTDRIAATHIALAPGEAWRPWAGYRLMAAGECLGAAAKSLDLAVGHARERRQFGVPIGSFQAVKHRLADAAVRIEDARALVADAARAVDDDRVDAALAVDTAIAAAGEAALRNTADAIQVHGALGVCWEHPCHLLYKRARKLVSSAADPAAARARVAARLVGRAAAVRSTA